MMLSIASPAIGYVSQVVFYLALSSAFLAGARYWQKHKPKNGGTIGDINRKMVIFGCTSALGVAALLALVGLPIWVAVIGGGLGGCLLGAYQRSRHVAKYLEDFDKALCESLDNIASSLRAGLTLQDALRVAVSNCPEAFANEVEEALKQYHFGTPIEQALDDLRQKIKTQNCNIAMGAMIISTRLGGKLPAMLRKISETIRERQRIEGKLKALTAQGRSQSFLLCSAPPILGVGMYFYDPDKMRLLTDTPIGQVLLVLAIVLEVVGIVATMRVMKLEV